MYGYTDILLFVLFHWLYDIRCLYILLIYFSLHYLACIIYPYLPSYLPSYLPYYLSYFNCIVRSQVALIHTEQLLLELTTEELRRRGFKHPFNGRCTYLGFVLCLFQLFNNYFLITINAIIYSNQYQYYLAYGQHSSSTAHDYDLVFRCTYTSKLIVYLYACGD